MGEPEVAVAAAVLGSWLGATTNLNVVREVEIVWPQREACLELECPVVQCDLERCWRIDGQRRLSQYPQQYCFQFLW